jgi:hypothetical protein
VQNAHFFLRRPDIPIFFLPAETLRSFFVSGGLLPILVFRAAGRNMQGKKNETEHVHFDSKTRVFIEILVLSLIINEFYLFSCILFLFKA